MKLATYNSSFNNVPVSRLYWFRHVLRNARDVHDVVHDLMKHQPSFYTNIVLWDEQTKQPAAGIYVDKTLKISTKLSKVTKTIHWIDERSEQHKILLDAIRSKLRLHNHVHLISADSNIVLPTHEFIDCISDMSQRTFPGGSSTVIVAAKTEGVFLKVFMEIYRQPGWLSVRSVKFIPK